MNITSKSLMPLAGSLLGIGLLLSAGPAMSAVYYLCAKAGTVTMPGGVVVPIWGYVQDDNANLADGCPALNATTWTVAMPALTVPAGDLAGLTVHLRNDLTAEPTSLVIPGQTATMTPVKINDPQGRPRVRSFTHEAAANGGTAIYTWADIKPGTYLYHSGSHPQVQVQMGLYGALTSNFLDGVPAVPAAPPNPAVPAVPGQAYDGVPFGAELALLFSEIDPAQHAAIVAGTFGTGSAPATPCNDSGGASMPMTSTLCYKPKYFLINGKPYPDSNAAMPALSLGQDTLLRMLNAGLRSYVPTIQGTHMKMIAEDGNRYQYRDLLGVSPRDQFQYSTLLASLKTTDAVITPATLQSTAIYDRRLHLVNNLAQNGGMFVSLNAACNAGTCTDLSITKSDGVTSVSPGAAVTYNIVVSNAGPTAVTGATVTDNVPAALAATAAWTCTPAGTAVCGLASGAGNISTTVDLAVGDSVTFAVSGTVDPLAAGSMVNIASVVTPAGVTDPNPGNNSANDTDAIVLLANLSVTKTDGVTSIAAGNPVSYTIVASNAGPDPVTGAMVTDTLPAAITGASWTCTAAGGATCAASGTGNLNTAVNLPAGGSATFTVSGTVALAATGSLVNTATVVAPAGVNDTSPADNSATDTDTITPPPVVVQAYFSTAGNTAVPGVAGPNDDADIYARNSNGTYTRVFDASVFGVPGGADVDAFVYNGPNDIYLSFNGSVVLPNLDGVVGGPNGPRTVQGADIVHWNGAAWSLYFDGSDVGLTAGAENVDAFAFHPDGSLLVSTSGNPSVPGLPAGTPGLADEDLLRCVGTFGPTTTCSWSLYFEGSDIALSSGSENVDFVRVTPSGDIRLSTTGNFSAASGANSLTGNGNQVFACTAPSTGTATACGGLSSVLILPALPTGSMDAISQP